MLKIHLVGDFRGEEILSEIPKRSWKICYANLRITKALKNSGVKT